MIDLSKYREYLIVKPEDDIPQFTTEELHETIEYYERLCKEAPMDRFPDFLLNPIKHTYDDEDQNAYIERAIFGDNPLIASAKMVRRKYADYFDYLDAMAIYDDYMDFLADKYGSRKIAKSGIRKGIFPDYLPPKPRLKNKKENRVLLEGNFVPSRRNPRIAKTFEELEETTRIMFPEPDLSEIPAYPSDKPIKYPKSELKAFKKYYDELDSKNRKLNMFTTKSSTNSALDAIIGFMKDGGSMIEYNKKGKKLKKKKKNRHPLYDDSYDNWSIAENIKELHKYDGFTEEEIAILEKSEFDQGIEVKNGRMRKADYDLQMEIYTKLMEQGFNVMGIASNTMDKTSVKMLKSRQDALNGDRPLSKKELKKKRKKQRKAYDKKLKKMEKDAYIGNTLLNNRIKFKRDPGKLEFRLSDIDVDDDDPLFNIDFDW